MYRYLHLYYLCLYHLYLYLYLHIFCGEYWSFKLRASCLLGKHSTILLFEPCSQPFLLQFVFIYGCKLSAWVKILPSLLSLTWIAGVHHYVWLEWYIYVQHQFINIYWMTFNEVLKMQKLPSPSKLPSSKGNK
jgi:hypothetical protein